MTALPKALTDALGRVYWPPDFPYDVREAYERTISESWSAVLAEVGAHSGIAIAKQIELERLRAENARLRSAAIDGLAAIGTEVEALRTLARAAFAWGSADPTTPEGIATHHRLVRALIDCPPSVRGPLEAREAIPPPEPGECPECGGWSCAKCPRCKGSGLATTADMPEPRATMPATDGGLGGLDGLDRAHYRDPRVRDDGGGAG